MNVNGLEGWFTDPYERHKARWMSQGEQTKLVRDDGIEAYDNIPDTTPTREPTRIRTIGSKPSGGVDLRRSDEAENRAPCDPHEGAQAAVDSFDQSLSG